MSRPRKARVCSCMHGSGFSTIFTPAGVAPEDLEVIRIAQDELEALHLCDGQGKTQEEAGRSMGVSRGTVQRLVAAARRKVAVALVGRMALAVCSELVGCSREATERIDEVPRPAEDVADCSEVPSGYTEAVALLSEEPTEMAAEVRGEGAGPPDEEH